MKRQIVIALIWLVAGLVAVERGMAANWPDFRGPTRQGLVDSGRLPVEFGESANVAWKTPIAGRGWSTPVIWENQIWMTTSEEEGRRLIAVCVDRESGAMLREIEVFRPEEPVRINAANSHASPSPVIEAGRVYVHFGTMGTACIDTTKADSVGEAIVWKHDLLKLDHKEGPGSSPVMYKDLLIVHCDGMDTQYVAALHKATGEVAWKTARTGAMDPDPDLRKAYSTPLVITVAGEDQLVSVGADHAVAYRPADGSEIWRVDYKGFSNVPRPLFDGRTVYLCTGFHKCELWAIRPDGQGNVTDTHVAWREDQQIPKKSSPILVEGAIYMVSDRGVASCLDAETGSLRWRERLGGNYSASPIHANGCIYFSSEEGQVTVVAAKPEFEILAENSVDGALLASLAAVDGALFLRSDTHLYRFEDAATARR